MNSNIYKYDYNTAGAEGSFKFYLWNGSDWNLTKKQNTNFKPNTYLPIKDLYKILNNGVWENVSRDTIEYYKNDKFKSSTTERWSADINKWQTFNKIKQDYYKDGSVYHYYRMDVDLSQNYKQTVRYTYTHNGCILQLQRNKIDQQKETFQHIASNRFVFNDTIQENGTSVIYENILTAAPPEKTLSAQQADIKGKQTFFSLSPNPAKDYFIISVEKNISPTAILNVTDITGKIVLNKKINTGTSNKIDVSNVAAGIYFITLKAGDKNYYNKLVVE